MLLTAIYSLCRTYFIEYQFPVVATARDRYSPNAMATEVMRVASKNVKEGGNYSMLMNIKICRKNCGF